MPGNRRHQSAVRVHSRLVLLPYVNCLATAPEAALLHVSNTEQALKQHLRSGPSSPPFSTPR